MVLGRGWSVGCARGHWGGASHRGVVAVGGYDPIHCSKSKHRKKLATTRPKTTNNQKPWVSHGALFSRHIKFHPSAASPPPTLLCGSLQYWPPKQGAKTTRWPLFNGFGISFAGELFFLLSRTTTQNMSTVDSVAARMHRACRGSDVPFTKGGLHLGVKFNPPPPASLSYAWYYFGA